MNESVVRNARLSGLALLGTVVLGIVTTSFVTPDIDVNLNPDFATIANNMIPEERALRAKSYLAGLVFLLEALFALGLYQIFRRDGSTLAALSLVGLLAAAFGTLFGGFAALTAAEWVSADAFIDPVIAPDRLLLLTALVSAEYTVFHLGLVLGSLGKAGFLYLLLTRGLMHPLIAGWGLFASLLAAFVIVTRDFVPALANNVVSITFMSCHLVALVAVGFYLAIHGVRHNPTP
ncbi:MAG: DUF4386 family protein [Pseudomonadota bacterium]